MIFIFLIIFFFFCISSLMCVYFFFFQAEDGIRDLIVTGVQTCALPIFLPGATFSKSSCAASTGRRFDWRKPRAAWPTWCCVRTSATIGGSIAAIQAGRSEERRVGKECRSRWSPYH